ncbi:hypothetical protein [Arthrobacter sp. STN4]|uniref:hypothetical protein n=1 Tax=Arthrobacter sp. STN4 TaxID=2923276 RepID=UPI00211A994E|nr:hypothetical protein [Arthrobacter sp. STN4]MCQ9163990.1 hypothetical protein [Arthrobacter sp. STN4]
MTTLPAGNLSGGIADAGVPALICTRCGTGNDLVIEAIEATSPALPGQVSLEYSCLSCGSFYGHDASVGQVAALLNAGATAPGVLHFGHHYIHCGEPMEETGEGLSCLNDPWGSESGLPATISLRTRLLKCHCGFQLDAPR